MPQLASWELLQHPIRSAALSAVTTAWPEWQGKNTSRCWAQVAAQSTTGQLFHRPEKLTTIRVSQVEEHRL